MLVRAPLQASISQIESLLADKADWIKNAQAKIAAAPPPPVENPLSMEEIRALAEKALAYIPERVRYYAPMVGVTFGRITIRNQKSRWGSCSAKGNFNFNCLLMLTPPEVIDSVDYNPTTNSMSGAYGKGPVDEDTMDAVSAILQQNNRSTIDF